MAGQYGSGLQFLYYALVATCVLVWKTDWLQMTCLAVALLLLVITALHDIVLAALHGVD